MKVLSLFSGVGGFDLGLEAAGMQTIYQCEWDKHATNILNRHWPHVPKWGDITTLTAQEILRHGQMPDVVAWGSPCQDLSVAGKRAGLSGERSGLFHEGIRLIKELRKETNNEYPRISIWENVAGAMSSNGGADFGEVLNEMAEAGAMVIEWAILDAQHFGVPQRRRRVFVIAIFDPAIAGRCPNPLLPVSESLRGDSAKGRKKRKDTSSETSAGFGIGGEWWSGGEIADTITSTSDQQRMPDKNRMQAVVSQWAAGSDEDDILRTSVTSKWSKGSGGPSGSEFYNMVVGSLAARDYKGVGSQYVDEGKVIVEPFVKSRRPQSSTDDETWVEAEVNPTLNSFDVGDTRSTTAIVQPVLFENSYRDGPRIAKDDVTQTLSAKMGTGGGNTPMVAIGIQGNVIGRQPQNGPAGKGYTEDGDPMFTLTSTDVHAVAFQPGTMSRLGGGVWEEVAPTLRAEAKRGDNEPHVAIQYDGFNQKVNDTDVSVTLRIGRDSSDFVAQESEPSMAVRRLTPVECERLMGWPDNWTDGQSDTHRYKQCGNGVASPVAKWIAQHLLNI